MQTLSLNQTEVTDLVKVTDGDHVVACFEQGPEAPTLLVFGSIHGNEQSGIRAMKNIAKVLLESPDSVIGNVWFIAGNTRAINKNVRHIDADLNRHWTPGNIERNSPRSGLSPLIVEDTEQRELLEIIEKVTEGAKNEVFAIDLHSTSSQSTPFAMTGDTLRNRAYALKFPATFLLGIEEQLDGTIMEYMNELGAVTLGFEAGQHTTRAAVRNQEALLWLALRNSGVVTEDLTDWKMYEEALAEAVGHHKIVEIRSRLPIVESDEFVMEPGYRNFQSVKKGEVLAHDKKGEIRATETGLILMPLYQSQGSDGFFLGRDIASFWLWLSRLLRNSGAGNLMPWLPGVKSDPDNYDALMVNTRVARLMPLQIFHLLGFRRMRWSGETLVVTRRKHDTQSPFIKNSK
jgi:succinylglutamate desuccinylase